MNIGRIIAIGDIHGCSDALRAVIQAIDPRPEDTLIPLGDFINRGPDSRGVMDQLIQLCDRCILVPILGNHEEMFLGALGSLAVARNWLACGGIATLGSYGFRGNYNVDGWQKVIPLEHIEFMRNCQAYYETTTHIFLHAYFEPNLPMVHQPESVLRWASLRDVDPAPHYSGKTVIVGHTSQKDGEILDLSYIKCIDTYCHGNGWLTALDVQTGRVWQANKRGEMREE